jgi:hypothetical protein
MVTHITLGVNLNPERIKSKFSNSDFFPYSFTANLYFYLLPLQLCKHIDCESFERLGCWLATRMKLGLEKEFKAA